MVMVPVLVLPALFSLLLSWPTYPEETQALSIPPSSPWVSDILGRLSKRLQWEEVAVAVALCGFLWFSPVCENLA